jgi:hypothetical protein
LLQLVARMLIMVTLLLVSVCVSLLAVLPPCLLSTRCLCRAAIPAAALGPAGACAGWLCWLAVWLGATAAALQSAFIAAQSLRLLLLPTTCQPGTSSAPLLALLLSSSSMPVPQLLPLRVDTLEAMCRELLRLPAARLLLLPLLPLPLLL